jgi:hypothetical protein
LIICSKKKFNFELSKTQDTPNTIIVDPINKKLEINISDIDDINLLSLINEKTKELQQLFE